ncbi:MAG: hypothetical protein ABIH69_04905 [bacterium]
MYQNKYAHVNSLALLKSSKPRKGFIAQGPDLANFITGDDDIKLMANFGLEMRKFLPDFEQLMYAGKMLGTAGDVHMEHGGGTTYVTDEWWDAFNEYGIAVEDLPEEGAAEGHQYQILAGVRDYDGDGLITNADTIAWYEEGVPDGDGLADFRGSFLNDRSIFNEDGDVVNARKRWISGQHHRVGRYTPFGSEDEIGVAGAGLLGGFRNIKDVVNASDWNHINRKNGSGVDAQSERLVNRSYFIAPSEYSDFDFLGDIVASWSDIDALLARPEFEGKSFYQIIMDPAKAYQRLSGRDAALLIAGMYESRERAWMCMTEVFGDVTDTRNDDAMMEVIDSFVMGNNPYMNHHALSLFPMFLYMQHSFQNRVSMFYEQARAYDGSAIGWNKSVLDEERFLEFAEWMGGTTYGVDPDDYDDIENPGALYDYRDSLGEGTAAYNAVNQLIDKWFGASDVENERPLWEGYGQDLAAGRWVNVRNFTLESDDRETVDWVWEYDLEAGSPSYAWDRKWSKERMYFSTDRPVDLTDRDGEADGSRAANNGNNWRRVVDWTNLHQSVYGDQSKMSTLFRGGVHPNYLAPQFSRLNYNETVMGQPFGENWAVHGVGMFLKWGEGMDIIRVMERNAHKRVASAAFKQDKTNYYERKEELELEEAMEEKIAMKLMMKRRAERKKMEKGKAKPKSSGTKQSSGSSKRQDPGALKGSKKYAQRMQKFRQRLLRASSKRKAWLKKTKEANK